MGQQCQVETIHGFISCSLQRKTSLLAWTAACASLCTSFSVCFESSARRINLLAILLGAGILQLWAWLNGGVYKSSCLDAFESLFTLNLIMLAAATYYVELSKGNQLAVGYTSVIIALGTFIAILIYHIFKQLRNAKLRKEVNQVLFVKLKPNKSEDNPQNDSTESVNLDQLREPWLEDLLQPTHSSF